MAGSQSALPEQKDATLQMNSMTGLGPVCESLTEGCLRKHNFVAVFQTLPLLRLTAKNCFKLYDDLKLLSVM